MTPKSYRIRLVGLRWYVKLYADMTMGDCVGAHGPYSCINEAKDVALGINLIDGDKGV